ncbi:MAG: four helix bundle protein [Sedimentisphaerales bacterium]|jgi:four helix bundle protein|nr:four helix bundle protein [Sedimentisphaerales bacterium]
MYYSYEDLDVWKRSVDVAVGLYALLANCRDYGIRDQLLRSAVSIPSNVAEGAERDSKKDFVRFLRISKGSAAELRTQLYIAGKANVADAESCARVRGEVTEISRMLQGLIVSLGRSNRS